MIPKHLYHQISNIINSLEETLIALILGSMTLITFANVVARYLLETNILWALELTVFLFAWLVLLGMSYCAKKISHIGVDIFIQYLPQSQRRISGLIAIICCLTYSLLLLKGAWDYWYQFLSTMSFLEVNDIPMPEFLQFLSTLFNEGEAYEKLPRFIPYLVLPLSLALLTYRFLQLGYLIWIKKIDRIIASHEVEITPHNSATSSAETLSQKREV